MEASEIGQETQLNPRNTKEAYLRIIGLDKMPQNPETMPSKVFLPAGGLGDLEQATLATTSDDIERSQMISYDSKRGFTSGKLLLGTKEGTGTAKAWDEVAHVHLRHLHLWGKGLVDFHTHPHNVRELSFEDVRSFLITRNSFIELIGAGSGIIALFQTEKAARTPFSWFVSMKLFERKYSKYLEEGQRKLSRVRGDSEDDFRQSFREWESQHQLDFIKLLEDEGFAYYEWVPDDGKVKPGDLQDGIPLARVLPNLK